MDPYNSADAQAPAANPYAAPTARVAQPVEQTSALASRWARLGGALIDGFTYGLCLVPALANWQPRFDNTAGLTRSLFHGAAGVTSAVLLLSLFGLNLFLIHRTGQSIGKKLVGTRIVRKDGSRASLGRVFALRMLLPGVVGRIPLIGSVFGLVNALFIFGTEKRCIHDMIADTIVVDA